MVDRRLVAFTCFFVFLLSWVWCRYLVFDFLGRACLGE